MTPIEKQALRDICENPFDDAPRLIYCDWLEEQGRNERTEFIRVQIKLERTDFTCKQIFISCCEFMDLEKMKDLGCQQCKEFARLKLREGELWRIGKSNNWFQLYAQGVYGGMVSRGFVNKTKADFKNWRHRGKSICRYNPIEKVMIPGLNPLRDGELWFWMNSCRIYELPNRMNCFIPEWLKDLPGNVGKTASGRIYFNSEEDARRLLSLALVNHSRRQLGMPDLEW